MTPDNLKQVWREILPYVVIALIVGVLSVYGLWKVLRP